MPHKILKNYDRLKADRSNWESLWEEIARFVQPDRGDFHTRFGLRTSGKRNRQSIFDSTGEQSLEIFASSIMGIVANQATRWFTLDVVGIDVTDNKEIQEWLDTAGKICMDAFNESDAKFYDHLFSAILDIGAFGSASLSVEEGIDTLINFKAISPRDIVFTESSNGLIQTTYTNREFTIEQLIENKNELDWDVPETVTKIQEDTNKTFEVVRCVRRNTSKRFNTLGKDGMLFEVMHVLREGKHLLNKEGFNENPIATGRWKVSTREVYGRSPAMMALPDIMTLNQSRKAHMMAADKQLNPPMMYHHSFGKLNLGAGGRNPVDTQAGTIEQIQTIGNLSISLEMEQELRQSIRSAFFVDVFQTAETPNITATEATIRTDERMRILSPNIARINSELIGQVVQRVFAILQRAGRFPDMPEVLASLDVKIKFESPITRAQRAGDFNSIMNFITSVGQVAQVNPVVLDKIDFDELVNELHETSGSPVSILKAQDAVDKLREQQAEAQQQQQELDQVQQGAGIAKDAQAAGLL